MNALTPVGSACDGSSASVEKEPPFAVCFIQCMVTETLAGHESTECRYLRFEQESSAETLQTGTKAVRYRRLGQSSAPRSH